MSLFGLACCVVCALVGGAIGFAWRDHLADLIEDEWSGPTLFGEGR